MIETRGNACFNWRVHSTPFKPGKLISINTTSGPSLGRPTNAVSASPYWLTQRNPSERFSTRASVPRNCSLSSTMETVIGMASAVSLSWRGARRQIVFVALPPPALLCPSAHTARAADGAKQQEQDDENGFRNDI